MSQIPYVKVFISSPGDVSEERKVILEVLDLFPSRPAFRDRVAIRPIAWDKAGSDTPMLAKLTPQEAINNGLPRPSDCDIVIVIFWSRMGTPFTDVDGEKYMSGTHWELLDALKSSSTQTVIYQCTRDVTFAVTEEDRRQQYLQVIDFFKSNTFYEGNEIKRGINRYNTIEDFRRKFETHFEALIVQWLAKNDQAKPSYSSDIEFVASTNGTSSLKEQFIQILENDAISVDHLRAFLIQHPSILLDWIAWKSGSNSKYVTNITIGDTSIDFAVGFHQPTIGQWEWKLVLVATQNGSYYTDNGNFTSQVGQAIDRANQFKQALQTNLKEIREILPDIEPNAPITILCGRRANISDAEKKRVSLLRLSMPGITLNTFDSVLDSIKEGK